MVELSRILAFNDIIHSYIIKLSKITYLEKNPPSVAPHPSPILGAGTSLYFTSLDCTRRHSKDTRSIKNFNAHISTHFEESCKLPGRFNSFVFYNYFS